MARLPANILSLLSGLLMVAALRTAYCQEAEPSFRHLTINDGLSQSFVNSIAQDSTGFLWFGTQDGLNRFDGYSITVFSRHIGDSSTISDDYIWSIAASRTGVLWIGTYHGGMNRYDPVTGRFSVVPLDSVDPLASFQRNITSLCEDRDGALWIGTWGAGLICMRYDSSGRMAWRRFIARPGDTASLVDNRVSAIYEDSRGDLWIGTWNGLARMTRRGRASGRFLRYQQAGTSLPSNLIWRLAEDRSGDVWVGTWGGGLVQYDRLHDRFVPFSLRLGRFAPARSKFIGALLIDRRGHLWIGTGGDGLLDFDITSGNIRQFRDDPADIAGLGGMSVQALFEDRGGTIWVGVDGLGLAQFDRRREQFQRYHRGIEKGVGLTHNLVRGICSARDGGWWVGTRGGGVSKKHAGRPGFEHVRHQEGDAGSLSSDLVLSVLETRRGDLLVGTQDAGLDVRRAGESTFRHFHFQTGQTGDLPANTVMTLLQDAGGALWVGTNGGGLFQFDVRSGIVARFRRRAGDTASIANNWVWSLFEDQQGSLWIGTWGGGFSRMDRRTGQWTTYTTRPNDSTSLSHNTVLSFAEDPKGILWVGTEGGGLNRFDPSTGLFRQYHEHDGLPNDVIYGILPDGRGNLWLSTNHGLSRFSPSTGAFRNYDVSDGLQSNEFNQGASCRLANGMLLFGGTGGLNAFFPDSIRDNTRIPPVVVTRLEIHDRPALAVQGIITEVVLRYPENAFAVEFAALDFAAPEKHRYAYMLEGVDPDWIETGVRRYARYVGLEGGTYTLRIKGSNGDGFWNDQGVVLAVTVLPPYWKTAWFRALGVVVLIAALGFLYRYRLQRAVDLERIRIRIASDLHDDIGSALTRIAVHSEMIRTLEDPVAIRSTSEKIGAACREIIVTMSDVVWSIDARNDTIGDLLDRIRDYAADVLGARSTNFSLEHSGLDVKKIIPVDVRQNLYLILKEAVSNVARHSTASRVTITLTNEGGRFTMVVADDGHRRDPAHGTGQGLRNMTMRAERLAGVLQTAEADGFTVTLTMGAL
jgi:ligand-binding sensor domain-containing protein/signal transduction histidine kinase